MFSKLPEGCGLFAKVTIEKGDIICDYGRDLLDEAAGDVIASDTARAMYIFAFRNGMMDKEMYYDNFHHTMNIGRYINHSPKHPNSKGVVYYDKKDGNKPHILLVATRNIDALEQITFNYGKEFKNRKECVASCYECLGSKDAANHTQDEEEIEVECNGDEGAANDTQDKEPAMEDSNGNSLVAEEDRVPMVE